MSEVGGACRREARDDAAAARVELVERLGEADGRSAAFRIEVSAQASAVEVGDHARVQRKLERDEIRLAGPVVDEDEACGAADLGVSRLGREGADTSRGEQDRSARGVRRERPAAVRIGYRPAQVPLDRTAVGADDRADVGKRLIGARPGVGDREDVLEGNILQGRRRVARGHGHRRPKNVAIRDSRDRDRVRRGSRRAD